MKVSLKYFGVAFLIWVVGAMAGVVLSTANTGDSFITRIDTNMDYDIEQDIVKAFSSDNNVKAFILIASNDPEKEEFRRRMQRKKKRGRRM